MDREDERVMAKLDSIQEGVNEIKISQAVMATKIAAIEKRQDAHEDERREGKKVWTGLNISLLLLVVGVVLETILSRIGVI